MSIIKNEHKLNGVDTTYDTALADAALPPALALSMGLHKGMRQIFLSSEVGNLNSGDDLWSGANEYLGHTAAAGEPLVCVSTSAIDDFGLSTGLNRVFIRGIGADGLELEEVVFLLGTTPVSTLGSFLRVNAVHGLSASGTVAVGLITVTQDTSGILMGQINAGGGRMQAVFFSTPSDKTAFVNRLYVSVADNAPTQAIFNILIKVEDEPIFIAVGGTTTNDKSFLIEPPYVLIPPTADVRLNLPDIDSINVTMEATHIYILIENRYLR